MLSTVTQSCAVATKASDVCKNATLLYLHTFVQSAQIVAVYISYPLFHFVFFHSGCSPSCTTEKSHYFLPVEPSKWAHTAEMDKSFKEEREEG